MFLLRRAAGQALSAGCKARPVQTRAIGTLRPLIVRVNARPSLGWAQRRFASDEVEPAEPKADEGAATTSSDVPPPTNFTDSPAPSSADADDHSTIASAISSAASKVSTATSQVADSVSESTEEARSSVADGAAAAAAAVGLADAEPSSTHTRDMRSEQRRPATPNPTVFLANLFFSVTHEELGQHLSRVAEPVNARVITDKRGLSKGIAFVEFKSAEDAARVIEEFNGKVFEGRTLLAQFSDRGSVTPRNPPHRPKNPPSRTLFIGNMSFELTDHDLNELFRDVANVKDVRVAIDRRTGQPRGFAHADFVDVASAQKALDMLADKELMGRRLRVDFGADKVRHPNQPSEAPMSSPSDV